MPDRLYETDALAWAERQADLLRRLSDGERVHDVIDWAHVIEEVQDVGLAELHACESLLEQAVLHLLKLYLEPHSQAASHWRGEIVTFLANVRRRFSPSMRQRIDLPALYAEALLRLRAEAWGRRDARIPEACPFALDDLLAPSPDIDAFMVRLAASAPRQQEGRNGG